MKKLIFLQSLVRGRQVRKKYGIFKTKETNASIFNFKDTYSDNRSINIGTDIINDAGLSNGANSNTYKKKSINFNSPFNKLTNDSNYKNNIILQDIVRKK